MFYIPWYLTLVRLIVPMTILRFPLLGILASIGADTSDWGVIGVTSSGEDTIYQSWDKALDLYSFLFIVVVVYKWKDIWTRRVALGLFAYRFTGIILFWIIDWRPTLFFFPNVFENFVTLCFLIFWLFKKKKLNLVPVHRTIMLGVLIVPKMIHEYFQHLLGRQPWEIYNFGSWLGFKGEMLNQVNWMLWGGLLYIVPMGGFLLYIKDKVKPGTD